MGGQGAGQSLYVSAIPYWNFEIGVLRIERRDRAQGADPAPWIDDQLMPAFAGRILAVDAVVALRRAKLHVPNKVSERDALLAATALVHGMTMVTRNIADFEPTQVPLLESMADGIGEE